MNREIASQPNRYARSLFPILAAFSFCWGAENVPAPAQEASCLQTGTQPALVAAVQGTDDYNSIDVASRFLTGCSFSCQKAPQLAICNCQSVFHVPSGWPCTQLHLASSVANYREYYWDKTYVGPNNKKGMDESKPHGLEFYPILFYVGEGTPEHLDAWPGNDAGGEVELRGFSLGDVNVRYLLMLSCNLLAHGPRTSATPDHDADFTSPNDFKPSEVRTERTSMDPDPYMADVFYRWGFKYDEIRRPLNLGLRLVCGGSSRIGSTAYPTHRFWYYFSVLGWRPADAFLAGLYAPERQEVPLCISRGDTLQESGLDDSRFETKPLVAGSQKPPNFIFIEYPLKVDDVDPLVKEASKWAPVHDAKMIPPPSDPNDLPVLVVGPPSTPPFLSGVSLDGPALDYGFRSLSASTVRERLELLPNDLDSPSLSPAVRAEDLCVKRHPDSGSLIFSWRPPARGEHLSDAANGVLDGASNSLLTRLHRAVPVPGSGVGANEPKVVGDATIPVLMQIRSAPANQNLLNDQLAKQEIGTEKGCLYILETVRVAGIEAPVLGEGSETFVGRCPAGGRRIEPPALPGEVTTDPCRRTDPPLASFVYNNLVLIGTRPAAQKLRKDALSEAWAQLDMMKRRAAYDLVNYRWGYRAAPVHCKQREMYLAYDFVFLPKRGLRYRDYKPLIIEIPAHTLPATAKRLEDTWTCSPEKAPG